MEKVLIYTNHYGSRSLSGYELSKFASWGCKKIRETKDEGIPVLIFRGLSGSTMATAINVRYNSMHQQDMGMVYVRKPEESSHSKSNLMTSWPEDKTPSEALIGNFTYRYYFVDDFIDRGNTFIQCMQTFRATYPNLVIPKVTLLVENSLGALIEDNKFSFKVDGYSYGDKDLPVKDF